MLASVSGNYCRKTPVDSILGTTDLDHSFLGEINLYACNFDHSTLSELARSVDLPWSLAQEVIALNFLDSIKPLHPIKRCIQEGPTTCTLAGL